LKTVRHSRYLILALFASLSLSCVFLFPKVKINEDMTEYLPSDSRMRAGLDTLERYFPEIDMNAYIVKAMFSGVSDEDSLDRRLCDYEGISGIRAQEKKDGYLLYQLTVEDGADPKAIAAHISEDFGQSVIVETNANGILPDNMAFVVIIGVSLLFLILFLMCSSLVEALLFIITIGFAVMANMGTNAFLPSVSMLTNAIGAILQLILSMDYSIILMNRYRQVLRIEPDREKAMSLALKRASSSILSSSFTTIVGLLALVFMKFKIGLDLGAVLAKGVLCSLISIYTILPGLILLFNKAIIATEKKVFLIPTDRLSRFEMRFRIPLTLLFVAMFIFSAIYSRRTELSYASIWESEISKVFKPQNIFSLLYRTEDEMKVLEICDELEKESGIISVLSYPSLLKQKFTAEQMAGEIASMMELLPSTGAAPMQLDTALLSENTLKVLYYARTHPDRDERFTVEQMLSAIPPEFKGMLGSFDIPDFDLEEEVEAVHEDVHEPLAETPAEATTAVVHEVAPQVDMEAIEELGETRAEVDTDTLLQKYHFTKENCTAQLSAAELAEFLGFSRSQASTAFSMAGHKGKKGTMSPYEFITYMTGTVINNKLLRRMISDSQVEGLWAIQNEMEAVLFAQEKKAVAEVVPENVQEVVPEIVPENVSGDFTEIVSEAVSGTVVEAVPVVVRKVAPQKVQTPEDFSVEELNELVSTLGVAGVDRGMLELLFIFCGSVYNYDEQTALSVEELVEFLCNEVALDEKYSLFIDDESRAMLSSLDDVLAEGVGALRKDEWSMAAIVTDCDIESESTYDYVSRVQHLCSESLYDDFYYVGESLMYKEMKDGFRRELLILTVLTVISIFLIVALTFRSLLIPLILVMTVMTGVYVNVIVSGFGGNTMLYLAYLIVQSILMGATIDYGILFTNYYMEKRKAGIAIADALREAYSGSIHTIMTSGLIIIGVPFIMSMLLSDPTLKSILSSLTFGAVAVIILILFVLPAVLAACDKVIVFFSGKIIHL